MASVAHARREEKKPVAKEFTRRTRGGRDLTYSLTVIQEPERARACGSGAKSSADRRPVDPPPVVELRIFSGPEREDITFAYEANFFLYATLEAARPIARGRVQHAPAAPIPVLTGMPVSGMAYLDRPTEAGYFIFPDLSVRHEGIYCLSFSLYEETRRDEDMDVETPGSKPLHLSGPNAPDSSFDFRLEIKSTPFTVFSAKKFPGLAESTNLSRTVAEQGCRVRIRRDVRMRRRDPKGGNDYDEPTEEEMRGRRNAEEEYHRERSRSHSSISERSPIRGDNGQYPHPHAAPQSHLDFLDRGPAASQFQASSHFGPPPPPPPPPSSYQPPPVNYAPAPAQYRPPPPPPPPAPASYGYDRQYPQPAYPLNPPREVYEPEVRRPSMAFPPAPVVDPVYSRLPYPPPQSPATPAALPPLKLGNPEPRHDNLAPLPRITSHYPAPPSDRAEAYLYPQPEPVESRNGKRTFENVFSGSASAIDSQRLANGQRPINEAVDDDDDDGQPQKLVYVRANGHTVQRNLPTYSA